jgi:hypothetical protein
MKAKKNVKVITPQGIIRKLILHFNIDKTIVMRDSHGYNNSDFMVKKFFINFILLCIDSPNII